MPKHAHSMHHYHIIGPHNHASVDRLLSTTGTYYRTTIKTGGTGSTTSTHSFVYNDTDGTTGIKYTTERSLGTGYPLTGQDILTDNTTTAGDNSAHNNMPPYMAAYCWKRVE